jgi:hypothetical protein
MRFLLKLKPHRDTLEPEAHGIQDKIISTNLDAPLVRLLLLPDFVNAHRT